MKILLSVLLLAIFADACTKDSARKKSAAGEGITVMVYATHVNDTTIITSTDSVHLVLK